MSLWKWSTTAATNATADSTINFAEGQSPGSVNDSARALMAAVAKFRDDIAYANTSTGTGTAYAVSTSQSLTTLTNKFMVSFIVHTENTGAATLAVDGLAAKPLRLVSGAELSAGSLSAGSLVSAVYVLASDEWVVMSGSAMTAALSAIGGLTPEADAVPYFTSTTEAALATLTSAGRALLDDANAAAQVTTLGLQGAYRGQISQALTASGSTLTVDMANGWHVDLTLSANVTTVAVSNWPSSGVLGRLTLDIYSTGAYNITGWPGTTRWGGGTGPTISSGSGKRDTIVLTSRDGGTNFRGYVAGQNFS